MTQPRQMTYAEALAVAAAAYAAARTPALVTPAVSLAATIRAGAAASTRIQESTVAAVRARWRNTNPYNDTEVSRFATEGGRALVSGQRSVAQVAAAAQTRAFESVGVQRFPVSSTVPDDVRGVRNPRTGRARVRYDGAERTVAPETAKTSRVLGRVAAEYRYSRSQQRSHVEALTAADTRIGSIVDGNLQLARAIVEERALEELERALAEGVIDLDREVVGYRRVIHPELSTGGVCGLCVVAADRRYKIGELKAIHNLCKCTVLPIFSDFDPGEQLNGDDLEALYKAAGANTRDKLKRTRYKLVEHAELGPQLVPQNKGTALPYFRSPDAPIPAPAPALV